MPESVEFFFDCILPAQSEKVVPCVPTLHVLLVTASVSADPSFLTHSEESENLIVNHKIGFGFDWPERHCEHERTRSCDKKKKDGWMIEKEASKMNEFDFSV